MTAKMYIYITNGSCKFTDKLYNYRLVSGKELGKSNTTCNAIRVNINENIKLEKYSCDNYSTTECDIEISELEPKAIIKVNGKLRVRKRLTEMWTLKQVKPSEFDIVLRTTDNIIPILNKGYVSKEQYRKYIMREEM